MIKPLTTTEAVWFGENVLLELFDKTDFDDLKPISQIQAVTFVDKDHLVLYKSGRGNYGIPGGGPDGNESWEETLKRETREEIAAKVISCGPLGYIKETMTRTSEVKYLLRYWSLVMLLDEPINDPDDPKRERYIFSIKEGIEKLNWGSNGEVLVKLAKKKLIYYLNLPCKIKEQ